MKMNRRQFERNHGRRGTALLEFVMSLPILLLVIAGIFFFGQVMRNQQLMRVADRYVSWRHLHNGQAGTDLQDQVVNDGLNEPGDEAGEERSAFESAYREVNVVDPTSDRINEVLLSGRGENVGAGYGGWSNETREDLVVAAGEEGGQDAGDLADQALSEFPGGSQGRVSAEFPQEQEALDRIRRMISSGHQSSESSVSGSNFARHGHHREGRHWRRWEASYLEGIRDLFLSDFDDANHDISDGTLRQNVEDLYLRRW
jgi:hypothetical protein